MRAIVEIPDRYRSEDGDAFGALRDALETAEIPAHVWEERSGNGERWWVITGRQVGDDEDTMIVLKAKTRGAAEKSFVEELYVSSGVGHGGYRDFAEYWKLRKAKNLHDERHNICVNHIISCGKAKPKMIY